MAIVTLQDVYKSYNSEIVLSGVNLHLYRGEKVGMVGSNGSGKSTILKIILGETAADKGEVIRQKGLKIGYLPQEPQFDGRRTVMEEMHAGFENLNSLQERIQQVSIEMEKLNGKGLDARMREYDRLLHRFEAAGGYEFETEIKIMLAGVGFEAQQYNTKTSALSGGQLSRLGLAKVLETSADLLLLDEPTNHLDLQATEWLERLLAGYKGAVVLVSHDRFLLDRLSEKIIEVENNKIKVWKGNYSSYIENRRIARLEQKRQHQERMEMVERTRDFIARNKDQEGMRKTARGRKKRLNRLLKERVDFLEKPVEQRRIDFSFSRAASRSELVLRCEGLSKNFGDLILFKGISFDVLRGERLGISGPNGTGKSTLLKLSLGLLESSAGVIRFGQNLRVGYLDQQGGTVEPERTVLEEARSVVPKWLPEQVRGRLGAFLFSGDDVDKKCSELSGGQLSRLMLCKLVLSGPDVLVLDEPTNHLDIAGREKLEEALEEFDGTIIVVSHDRFFLDRIADRLLVMGVDELGKRSVGRSEFAAGEAVYSRYAELVEQRRRQFEEQKAKEAVKHVKKAESRGEQKQGTRTPEEIKRFNKYTVEQIEQMIDALEERSAEMKERFGNAGIYKNPQLLARLQKDYECGESELELLYRAYDWRIERNSKS